MKIMIYVVLFFIFFLVDSVSASSKKIDAIILNNKVNDFLKKEKFFNENNSQDIINIIIRTPLKKNIYCHKSIFSLLSNVHSFGLIDLLLMCDQKKYYLKVEIQSTGEYIVANKYIPRGVKIKESDLKILIGRLDKLPSNTYRNKKDIIGKINLRNFFPLQPITSFMVRRFWLVEINQEVTIIIKGNNFTIFSKAKALNNGAKNEIVRVKTNTGKIMNGIVNQKSEVIINF